MTFTVTLSAAAAGPVTFTYSTADGSAGSSDYVGTTNILVTFAPGETSKTITVPLINDNIVETGGETFVVNLANPVGATIADGQAQGTILEQDQLIVGTEGNDDTTTLMGGPGDDTIRGLGGNDGLAGGPGNDLLDGGAGFDRAIYTNAGAGVNIQLAAGTATIGSSVDTLTSIESARGTAFGDIYNATGFGSGSSPNASSEGNNLNGFEGLGGDDQITGNGNTRIEYTNATAGVTVDLSAPALGAPVGATGFASGDASVGNDTIFGGVTRVRGSGFADTMTGSGANEIFEGGGGNDAINGGGVGDIDIALFSGVRGNYTITGLGSPGSSTVQDNVGGDGVDTLTNIELTEFSNAYVLNQRVLNLSTFGLASGKQIFGTNNNLAGAGDNLTLGANANGRLIDLAGGGTDTLTLATAGTYNLNLSGVEVLAGSGGNDSVSLQNAVIGMAVVLAVGSDTLNLANGNNSVTVSGTESIHGGTAFDTVTLGDATPVTINSIESVIGSSGNDQVTINADFGVSTVTASFNLDGGNDTVNLNFFGPGTVANLSLTNVEHLNSAAGGVQTVNLSNDVGLTSVDLGIGFHTLNLAPGDHNLSVANVFELHSFGNNNDTITFDVGPAAGPGVIVTVNQIIDLGWGGTDVLNLTGANDQLSMSIYGGPGLTVHDQTASGDVDLNLRNQQAGATYDLGDGNDTLHLFEDPDGFTSGVSVRNVETVIGTNNSDTITILDGTSQTTVLGSGGVDFITASNGDDHIRFDSFTDSTEGPGRDQVTGFNAANDVFEFAPGVLSGPVHFVGDGNVAPAVGSEQTFDGGGQVEARLANVGGLTVLQIDADGNGSMGGATDMEIQFTGVVGPLTDLNFLIV